MFSRSNLYAAAALLLCASFCFAGDQKPPQAAPMDNQNRMQLIRSLDAELVFIRHVFPIGKKGLTIKDGQLTPSEGEIQALVMANGPAARVGDRAKITNVIFKGKNRLIFEINGGPQKKTKWYEHISVGMGSGEVSPNTTKPEEMNARGSYVILEFDKYVPQMTAQRAKELLRPVFDFDAKSPVEAYMDSIPPKLKEAIKSHHVLVGMNREMVTYTLGRPPKKYREADYEEWIYGNPPDPVQFVRFEGDEVVRLEIMQVDGQKVVRTEKEIDPNALALARQQAAPGQAKDDPAGAAGAPPTTASGSDPSKGGPGKRPSLRRPGEAPTADPGLVSPNTRPQMPPRTVDPSGGNGDPSGMPPPQ